MEQFRSEAEMSESAKSKASASAPSRISKHINFNSNW